MATFSERLKLLRKEKGVTQKAVADAIGVTERGIRRYEAGDVTPGFDIIAALAEYFKVSTDYVIGVNDNPNSDETDLLVVFRELNDTDRKNLSAFAKFLLTMKDNPEAKA